jgi:hypothetical protein
MPATVMIFGAIYCSMDGLQKFETSVRQAASTTLAHFGVLAGRVGFPNQFFNDS